MTTILGISGSLRGGSINSALLRAASDAMPEGAELEIATIKGIPLYDGDVEAAQGLPDAVVKLKERVVAADGLLLVTPEYNNSLPGVFKNAIDWMSRPASDIKRVFGAKPVAIMGASAGNFGTVLAQTAWLPVLRTLGTTVFTGGRVAVPRSAQAFAPDGTLTDDAMRRQVAQFIANFVVFVERS